MTPEAPTDLKRSRRSRAPAAFNAPDQLPPHSIEAEQGVLGCILWNTDCLVEVQRRGDDLFYDLRHQLIFDAMAQLRQFDLITLQQTLKDRGQLDQVGGILALSALQDSVPSHHNLVYYLDIVVEKSKLRHIITTCNEVANRAASHAGGDLGELLWTVQSDLVSMLTKSDDQPSGEAWNIADLASYKPDNDPNCILGMKDGRTTRYLCRGHGAWLIGPSGVGKSSLSVQQAILWSAGRDFCGIMPVRPLRILYVQAENDIGDAAEQVQGIVQAMEIDEWNTPDLFEQVRENVKFVTERRTVGQRFAMWLERQIVQHRADVVVIDPLLSFAGIDVSRQDQCTNFLRSVLNPILADTGAVLIGAHHTGKPKESKATQGWTIYDHAYAGIGSSELVNWARAISVLIPIEHGKFELRLAKRGQRAWATHLNGDKTTSLFLQHAQQRIHWEQIDPPEEEAPKEKGKSGQPSKVDKIMAVGLGQLIDSLTKPTGKNDLAKLIQKHVQPKLGEVSLSTCKTVIDKLKFNEAIKYDGGYLKP